MDQQPVCQTTQMMTPEAYQEFMNSIVSRFSDEQIAILINATENALKKQEESELMMTQKFESATWRQKDLLQRISTKSALYRVERRILTQYLRTFFINPLTRLKPDLGNDTASIKKLEARIQFYQDIVNLLNQKFTYGNKQ